MLRDIGESRDILDEIINDNIIRIEKLIDDMLGGIVEFDSKINNYVFVKDGERFFMKNTASGIKQIAIIQILLKNRILTENSVLIIDEPETNLHPEWQVKLAEILVLLSKELNIFTFINSHSPQLIESIEVFSEKYGIGDETKFFLSKESENGFKVNEINRSHLRLLYDNLGNPYDIVDNIRAENLAKDIF